MQTRNTVQRQIVLQTVLRMHDHPTADTVYAAVAAEHPSISKATVYRNLNQLVIQGDIRRVPVPNGADRYDFRTDKHYHMRCRACGKVFDAPMAPLPSPAKLLGDTGGFVVEDHTIEFVGLCPGCYKKISEDNKNG